MIYIIKIMFALQILEFLLFARVLHCQAPARYKFVVEQTPYTRLCSSKNILTVNGQFPGPTLYVTRGERIIVDVYNRGNQNITIHWHGVRQPMNPWSDGVEYITQCPIQPGAKFSQNVILSTEEGTVWWHAHSEWYRATVHGAIVIHPKEGSSYPFPKPHAEVPIILGQWWREDITTLYQRTTISGGEPNVSDAFTINGQPGDLYPCSQQDKFKLTVDYGMTYMLRIVNAAMQEILFFAISNHNVTVVGTDGSYTKPLKTSYIAIAPGQTIDVLLEANQPPNYYYMAARAYSSAPNVPFDNTTTTAIIQYSGKYTPTSYPLLPNLPYYNDTPASVNFSSSLRSLASKDHPIDVPLNINTHLFFTISVNTFPCLNNSCAGQNGSRFSASMNNISFVNPSLDILEAYYYYKQGMFGAKFPSYPPLMFNFTDQNLPLYLETPAYGTEVKVLEYNSTVELVLQGTNVVAGIDHPMHLHGFSFYVVGLGLGNFDENKDRSKFNLVDPPHQNTIVVPVNGWAAIRFKADNPGVWFMHCHLDRHMTWGMDMTFIVRDGKAPKAHLLPPPQDMPPC